MLGDGVETNVGRGVFAREAVAKGEVLFVARAFLTGTYLTESLVASGKLVEQATIYINRLQPRNELILISDPKAPSNFINSPYCRYMNKNFPLFKGACANVVFEPNEFSTMFVIKSTKSIAVGQQLLIDYGVAFWRTWKPIQ